MDINFIITWINGLLGQATFFSLKFITLAYLVLLVIMLFKERGMALLWALVSFIVTAVLMSVMHI